MVGVLYKPANQRVAAITTRNDKLGGQGPPSPTLSGSTMVTTGMLVHICYMFVIELPVAHYQVL